MNKIINSRITMKHDIEEHWKKALNFIPKAGEVIVYDSDERHAEVRLKIGNGETYVNDLPFLYEDRILDNVNKTNVLAYHNPDLINVEYTNNNGGWKLDLLDVTDPQNPQSMPVLG